MRNDEMNEHEMINDLLPTYAAGTLDASLQDSVRRHLEICTECRDDLILWERVSMEIHASDSVVVCPQRIAMPAAYPRRGGSWEGLNITAGMAAAWNLVLSQIPLVRREPESEGRRARSQRLDRSCRARTQL